MRLSRLLAALAMAAALATLGGCASRQGLSGPGQPSMGAAVDLLSKQLLGGNETEAGRSEVLFQSLLRQLPNDSDTWFRLGNLYASNDRAEPAASAYQRALLADNGHARAWHNLAVIRLREAYAAALQAQVSVDSNEQEMARRIENLLDELGRMSVLGDQAGRPPARPQPKPAPAAGAAEPPAPAAPTRTP